MATPLDSIKRAMRLLGVYQIGEAPTADECDTALYALNSMIDSWSTESLFIYSPTLDSVPLVANQSTYTVGPTGVVITTRPVEVLSATTVTYNGVTYPLSMSTLKDFNAIPVPTVTGIPNTMHVFPNTPDITIGLWPAPAATMTLNLWSIKQITGTLALTDTLTLPPGYQRAIDYSLAEELAAEFDVNLPPRVQQIAATARRNIKRINNEIPLLGMPRGIPAGRVFIGINS